MIRLNTLRSKARTTIRKLPKIRPHGRNYVPVGLELGKRVFQTMQVLTAAGNPTDEEFHYQYDSAGRILQSAFAQTKQSTVTSVGPNGSFYEPQARSRARAVHNYNEFGELESLNYYWDCPELTTTPSQLIASNVNAYDHLGRRTSTAYNYGSPWTETFAYATNLDYLTSASYSDNSNWNGTWGYDAAQNRSDVTTDILNRITGKVGNANVSYAHNAVGERTLRTNLTPGNQFGQVNGKSHYQWSELGRLRQFKSTMNFGQSDQLVSKYDYRYRQDGLRVAKIGGLASTGSVELEEESSSYWDEDLADNSPTWRYSYDGQMPVWEDYYRYEGGHYMVWDVTRSTLGGRGIDMIERQRMSDKENPNPGTASRVFPLYDGHGNTMAEIVRTGPTSADFVQGSLRKYDAWGNSRLNSAPSGFHGYCGNLGHKEDPESGLTYMRARYYEPGTERFISEDPAHQGLNWYVYCGNLPTTQIDFGGTSQVTDQFAWGWGQTMGWICALAALVVGSVSETADKKVPDPIKKMGSVASLLAVAAACFAFALSFGTDAPTDTKMMGSFMAIVGAMGRFALSFASMMEASTKLRGSIAYGAVILTSIHMLMIIGALANIDLT